MKDWRNESHVAGLFTSTPAHAWRFMDDNSEQWEKVFAWMRVPTPSYIRKTSWLETVYRRKDQFTGQFEYKKVYSPEEEEDILIDRMAW